MSLASEFHGLHVTSAPLRLLEAIVAPGDAFVNARTDALWLRLPGGVETSCERTAAYAAAGAHGVFVPGAVEPDDLRALVAAVSGTDTTVNVLMIPGLPSIAELSALGIARASSGSRPILAAYSAIDAAARALLDTGASSSLRAGHPTGAPSPTSRRRTTTAPSPPARTPTTPTRPPRST